MPVVTRRSESGVSWLLAFLIPFVVLAVIQWDWAPPATAGDYAQYLLHAKAIVDGRPYADTGYIFHPDAWTIGPRAYPPGFPLTLVPIVAVVGTHSQLFRLLMLASLAAFAYLAWRRLEMDIDPWQAAVGVGFATFAIEVRRGTLAPISDAGFAALVWATVLAVDTTKDWTWRRSLLVTALGGAALAYRTAGIAVIGAFVVYVLLTWRTHRGRAAVPIAIWGVGGVLALLTMVRAADLSSLLSGGGNVIAHLTIVGREYAPSVVVPLLRPTSIAAINRAYYLFGVCAMALGILLLIPRLGRSFLGATCAVYVLMLVLAPVGEERYLWPLYPVAASALAVGSMRLFEWLRIYWPSLPSRRCAVAILGVVAAAALYSEGSRTRPDALVGTSNGAALFAWLRQTSEATPMRVAFFNPRVVALEAGVPAVGPLARDPGGQLRGYTEERISHVICQSDDKSVYAQRVINRLPQLFPDRFSLDYENPEFRVYRLLPEQAGR